MEDIILIHEETITDLILNCINNAVDAGMCQNIYVNISNFEGREITITICDDGIGIPKNILDDIFKIGISERVGEENSTGIGLALAPERLEQFEAKIVARSSSGLPNNMNKKIEKLNLNGESGTLFSIHLKIVK